MCGYMYMCILICIWCQCVYVYTKIYVCMSIYTVYLSKSIKGSLKNEKNCSDLIFQDLRNAVSAPKSPRLPRHTRLIHAADFIGATPPVNWELVGLLVCQGRKVLQQWKNIVYNCFSWKKQSFNVIPDANIYISQKFSNRSSPLLNFFPFVDIDFGVERSFSAFCGTFSV